MRGSSHPSQSFPDDLIALMEAQAAEIAVLLAAQAEWAGALTA
jgi:hypothetical protein